MRYIVSLFAILLSVECFAQQQAFDPDAPHLDKTETLKWLSAQSVGATFFNFNGGQRVVYDLSVEIALSSNKKVKVVEYGLGLSKYFGTYSVDTAGAIHIELRNYHDKWPDMYLYSNHNGIFLFPTDKKLAFDENSEFQGGGQLAANVLPKVVPYWPFRKVQFVSDSLLLTLGIILLILLVPWLWWAHRKFKTLSEDTFGRKRLPVFSIVYIGIFVSAMVIIYRLQYLDLTISNTGIIAQITIVFIVGLLGGKLANKLGYKFIGTNK